ncbi:hypothetical protein GKC33_13660, partial [Lactobacillus salivarius]|nr:hypothetical protein [Ligilactobacillus salivarius]
MEWNTLQTIHFSDDMKKKVTEIGEYLKKQTYFTNENMNRSRIIAILVEVFYELFVENNSRTQFQNRLNELKKIKPKDNEKLLRDISQIRQMQDIQALITLANY